MLGQDVDLNGPVKIDGAMKAVEAAFKQLGWNMTPLHIISAELEEPRLGLATTEQMLQELLVRAKVGGYADYRTVGPVSPPLPDPALVSMVTRDRGSHHPDS